MFITHSKVLTDCIYWPVGKENKNCALVCRVHTLSSCVQVNHFYHYLGSKQWMRSIGKKLSASLIEIILFITCLGPQSTRLVDLIIMLLYKDKLQGNSYPQEMASSWLFHLEQTCVIGKQGSYMPPLLFNEKKQPLFCPHYQPPDSF